MQQKRERVLSVLAPPLIFLSGFLAYILHHDYGLFTPEALLCITLVFMAGLVPGVLLAIVHSTRLRAIGFALLLFIFLDIQFDLIDKIFLYLAVSENTPQKYLVLIAALFAAQLIVLAPHRHIATIITTVFSVVLLTTLLIPAQKVLYGPRPVAAVQAHASDLPLILHIVLDGHIGIEGIPIDIEGGTELRELLTGFYERRGFRLYGRAYSQYLLTYNSITNLVNGDASSINASLAENKSLNRRSGWAPTRNDYFRQVAETGYRIRIYQSDYLDYCHDPAARVEYCFQYLSSSPQPLHDVDLSTTVKAKLLLGGYFFGRSSILRIIQGYYNKLTGQSGGLLPGWKPTTFEFSSLVGVSVISELKKDILDNPRGRLFFAHILLPHGPYARNADCQIRKDTGTWLIRRRLPMDPSTISDTQYRDAAYKAYFQQTVCTMSLLDDLLGTLDREGLLDDATVIIQGDHGSRITLVDPVATTQDSVTSRDFIDGFSTLFAIHSPVTEPGYDGTPRSIQNLFGELVLNKSITDYENTVFLRTGPRIRKLPMKAVTIPAFE